MPDPTSSTNQSKIDPAIAFPRRFVFHGNAVAAAVIIRRIGKEDLYMPSPVQGQSSLPTIGGHSESSVGGSQREFERFFTYGESKTQADGVLNADSAVTTLSASVRGLRMVNTPSANESPNPQPIEFTAGLISLAMRSTHLHSGPAKIEFSEPPQYQGLVLAGQPIHIELRREFMELSTMTELESRFLKDKPFFNDCRDSFMQKDPKKPVRFGQKIPRMNGYALCTIVRSITWGTRTIQGHVLTQTGFGSIYFGEMLVNDRNRRVTLVRVKMGSEDGGDAAFVEGDPNGDWVPPEN